MVRKEIADSTKPLFKFVEQRTEVMNARPMSAKRKP